MPPIKLYFLQASRCIRTAWLLDELGLEYEVKFANRENNAAPAEFKKEAGGLGKFPTLQDGDVTLYESGNITEYLCDSYDKQHTLLPASGDPARYAVLQWVHAAEGTFMTHGLAVTYARWFQQDGDVDRTVAGIGKNVVKDLDYLEAELGKSSGRFLLGEELTAADIMMEFSARFILVRELGTKGGSWPRLERWLGECERREAYREAVRKSGYKL